MTPTTTAGPPGPVGPRTDPVPLRTATVRTAGKTGVEMEALTAVSTACLTVYDMLKAAQKDMRIEGVRLLSKTGGKSGSFRAPGTGPEAAP